MEGFLEQILEVVAIIIKAYWVGFILSIEGGYTNLLKGKYEDIHMIVLE